MVIQMAVSLAHAINRSSTKNSHSEVGEFKVSGTNIKCYQNQVTNEIEGLQEIDAWIESWSWQRAESWNKIWSPQNCRLKRNLKPMESEVNLKPVACQFLWSKIDIEVQRKGYQNKKRETN